MPHKPPGKCIFCEAGNLTKEHFWPSWASPLINCPTDRYVEQSFTLPPVTMSKKNSRIRIKIGHAWTKKFRVVCARCNNGWMNQLETAARPFLTQLISTASHIMSSDAAAAVARWVALKIMVSEQQRRDNLVTSPSDLKKFRSTLKLPDNFRIWVARCGVDGWQAAYWRHTATVTTIGFRPVDERKNIQSVTFGIGDLLIHALHTTSPGMDLDLFTSESGVVIQLFPFIDDIAWPPGRSITAAEANFLRDTLQQLLSSSRVLWLPFPSE